MEKYSDIQLMPHQWEAFNGDTFIQENFLKLKEEFHINTAIELGTCLGSTALWLSDHFWHVFTIEVNPTFAQIAKERLEGCPNVMLIVGDSVTEFPMIDYDDDTIIFIDSHWYEVCPMQEELQIIANSGAKPVIAIHDFYVPDEPNLGYDSIHGQRFDIEWIKPKLDAIYGEQGYYHYYNSDEQSTEIKRGIVYIIPKK
jgi:hypothetical protein